MTALSFRFDAETHEYTLLDGGAVLPHITGLLEAAGLIDPTHYTEESRIRGTAVHDLTRDFDLGALPVDGCQSVYRPYLLAHAAAIGMLKPEILAIEQPAVHPIYRYGGRADRVLKVNGLRGVYEIKSGVREKAHQVQTAMQAMLDSVECGIPAEHLGRWCCYVKANGKFSIEVHEDKRDFDDARRILRDYAGR